MATWVTDMQGPMVDLDPKVFRWAVTPERDGSWQRHVGVRVRLPLIRFEGTPEEIAGEIQALCETVPTPMPEDVTTYLHEGRWCRTGDPRRFVFFLGIYVARRTTLPVGEAILRSHAAAAGAMGTEAEFRGGPDPG